ncbi:MAG TPA: hypothetical protein VD833_08920 [Vicinamibacterales bacterium]|nr:hypothetical protein [Vicinamibacterales bacterium]
MLLPGEQSLAISKHRLTADNVRRMFAVERELLKLLKEIPDFEDRAAGIDPPKGNDDIDGWTRVYEAIPEMAHVLERQQISAREYLLTKLAAMSAEVMQEAFLADEASRRLAEDELGKELLNLPAVRFWRTMDPALKAEAAEWKKVREEMGRH